MKVGMFTSTHKPAHTEAALHDDSRRIQISKFESCLGLCTSVSAKLRAVPARARTTAHTLHMVTRGRQRVTLLDRKDKHHTV